MTSSTTRKRSKSDCGRVPVASRDPLLPFGVLPRLLSRTEAARYAGVSPTLFDRAVKEKIMPPPSRFYGRVLWDLRILDSAITNLNSDNDAVGDDPFAEMAL